MPVLNWIGKDAVVRHDAEVPFRLLHDVSELACSSLPLAVDGPDDGKHADNLIVEGDNLLALKALLPHYGGQVKCIYIDPPYNTGQDERDDSGKRTGWVYSDNVDSTEMRDWRNKVVGDEAEDLCRHDKWLCMMYPRLKLLKRFLRDDGVIFASIDDIELASLRLLFDEIFGVGNRVGTIVWKNVTDNNPTQIATEHEYVLCYARDKSKLPKEWKSANLAVKSKLLEIGEQFVRDYSDQEQRQAAYSRWYRDNKTQLWPFEDYKFIDAGGIYTGMRAVHNPGKEGYRYDVVHPQTGKPCQQPMMGYRFPEGTMRRLLDEGRILFGEDETKLVELKVYAKDYRAKLSSLFELDGRIGTNEIKAIFPESNRPFDFPKPTELIEELLSFTTSGDDIVLDSFAGSGTTGQAVLSLNRADGQRRRFVLTEMKSSIAREITAERIRRALPRYGGGFRYATLGKPLFGANGHINPDVRFAELARFVWFMETGTPLASKKPISPLLGVHEGRAVYLLYNGILKDKSAGGGNVLTSPLLAELPAHDGPKTIYGTRCLIKPERLRALRIAFRQLPYELKVAR